MRTLTLLMLTLISPSAVCAGEKVSLFNGKDLTGWDTWLGSPKKGEKAIGLNIDPDKIYTVVETDGNPAIRISGQTFGALTSKKEFENYHFTLEFKWGEKRWPPRENAVRDSGLLYHWSASRAHRHLLMRSQSCKSRRRLRRLLSVARRDRDVEANARTARAPSLQEGGMSTPSPARNPAAIASSRTQTTKRKPASGTRSNFTPSAKPAFIW